MYYDRVIRYIFKYLFQRFSIDQLLHSQKLDTVRKNSEKKE